MSFSSHHIQGKMAAKQFDWRCYTTTYCMFISGVITGISFLHCTQYLFIRLIRLTGAPTTDMTEKLLKCYVLIKLNWYKSNWNQIISGEKKLSSISVLGPVQIKKMTKERCFSLKHFEHGKNQHKTLLWQ